MSDGLWQRFCVVGLGGHARTKLIPAIYENGQEPVAVVSRKPAEGSTFVTIAEAIAALPTDTVFVIASPPTVHAAQALAALEAGRDVIVEKPAFVTVAEAEAAIAAAERTDALLVEGFMNRHTATHHHFLAECARARPVAIDCTFTIPAVPEGTFRSDPAIGASNLYDIASYFLAALLDTGLPLDALALESVDAAGRPDRERLHLAGNLDGVAARALIGVDHAYANRLRLTWADGSAVEYEPFFYGRPSYRRLTYMRADGGVNEGAIEEANAFEAMFAVPRGEWRQSQPERLGRMLELTRQLERLGRTLAEFRSQPA